MRKYFEVVQREGLFGLDLIIESRVTGEVFFVLLANPDREFPVVEELRRMCVHVREIRQWLRDGVIKFAGSQVVYCKVYC